MRFERKTPNSNGFSFQVAFEKIFDLRNHLRFLRVIYLHYCIYDFKILDAVMEVNHSQKTKMIPQIKDFFKGNLKGKTIAVWGLSFKPHTDDIREAPALENINALLSEGVTVKVHDPEAMDNVKKILGDKIHYFEDPYDSVKDAD